MKRSRSTACNEVQIDEVEKSLFCVTFLQRYTLQARIGSGSQGQVWTAFSRARKQVVPVAVKALQMSRDAQAELKAHMILGQHQKSPNLIKYPYRRLTQYQMMMLW